MTIACATHFTDSSFSAVRVAAELARKQGESLALVNVLSPSPLPPGADAVEATALEALRLEAAINSEGVEVKVAVLRGPLGPTARRYCREQGAGLLVAGDTHHQSSGHRADALEQLAESVDVPLLVVRDEAPLLAWAGGAGPLKVLLALDRTRPSALAREWIEQLAAWGPIELVGAHVWWPPDEYLRRGLPLPAPDGDHRAVEAEIRKEAQAALSALPPNVHHRVHLEIGQEHIGDRLLALSVEARVDVFVIGTQPRSGSLAQLWSVSHDVLGLAPMSVICVPAPSVPRPRHRVPA